MLNCWNQDALKWKNRLVKQRTFFISTLFHSRSHHFPFVGSFGLPHSNMWRRNIWEGERGKNWMKTFLSLPFCSIHFTVTRKHRYKAVNLLRSMVYIAIILKTLCACCCFQFFCLFVFVIDLCMHTQTYLRTRTNSSSKTLYRIMWTFS